MCNSTRSASLAGWTDSACIILVAKAHSENKSRPCTYQVLTVKRSQKSSVLPKAYVFPGGKLDKTDCSRDWVQVYKKFGFTADDLKLSPTENNLPKEIALRITAVRETFEECGVLICGNRHKSGKFNGWASSSICNDEILKWRERVINDPVQFYQLCLTFELYPDIWSLNKWSNWVTPTFETRKFNTLFFLACFEQPPPTSIDCKEIEDLQWASPSEYISELRTKKIILPPPQFYEMSRFKKITDINQLSEFAKRRADREIKMFFPYRIQTSKGICTILPGDDLYPQELDVLKSAVSPYVETVPESTVQHRMEFTSYYDIKLKVQNYHEVPFHKL